MATIALLLRSLVKAPLSPPYWVKYGKVEGELAPVATVEHRVLDVGPLIVENLGISQVKLLQVISI